MNRGFKAKKIFAAALFGVFMMVSGGVVSAAAADKAPADAAAKSVKQKGQI